MRRRHLIFAGLCLTACGDSPGAEGSAGGSAAATGGSPASTTGAPGSSDGPRTSAADSAAESSTGVADSATAGGSERGDDESGSTGPSPAECGNGIVEDGEGCDDREVTARCTAVCQPPGTRLWLNAIGGALDLEIHAKTPDTVLVAVDFEAAGQSQYPAEVRRYDGHGNALETVELGVSTHSQNTSVDRWGDRVFIGGETTQQPWVRSWVDSPDDEAAWAWDWIAQPTDPFDGTQGIASLGTDAEALYAAANALVLGVGAEPWVSAFDHTGEQLWQTTLSGGLQMRRPELVVTAESLWVLAGTGAADTSKLCRLSKAGDLDLCWNDGLSHLARFAADDHPHVIATDRGPDGWRVVSYDADDAGAVLWDVSLFDDAPPTIQTVPYAIAIHEDTVIVAGRSAQRAGDIKSARGTLAILDVATGAVEATYVDEDVSDIRDIDITPHGTIAGVGIIDNDAEGFVAEWAI